MKTVFVFLMLAVVGPALAQANQGTPIDPSPSGEGKPFIFDAPARPLKSYGPPSPVRAPEADQPYMDDRRTDLCTFANPPPCKKPEPPKAPPPKGYT